MLTTQQLYYLFKLTNFKVDMLPRKTVKQQTWYKHICSIISNQSFNNQQKFIYTAIRSFITSKPVKKKLPSLNWTSSQNLRLNLGKLIKDFSGTLRNFLSYK